MKRQQETFKCTDEDLTWMVERMDDTGGYLVKGGELKFFVEHFVRLDREQRSLKNRLKRLLKAVLIFLASLETAQRGSERKKLTP